MTSPLRQVGKRNTPVVGSLRKESSVVVLGSQGRLPRNRTQGQSFLSQSFESLLLGYLFVPSGPAFAINGSFLFLVKLWINVPASL